MHTIKPFLLFLLVSSLSFSQDKEVYKAFGDSMSAIGNYSDAITYFDNELKKHPTNEYVNRWLGYFHLKVENYDSTIYYYNKALAVNAKCEWCYANLGKAYSLKEDNDKAMEQFNKAIELKPTEGLHYTYRAIIKGQQGNRFGAKEDYDKGVELSPTNEEVYYRRAKYQFYHGMNFSGMKDLNKAIELNPKNDFYLFERAYYHYSQRNLEDALSDITTAVDLNGNKANYLHLKGVIQHALHNYSEALISYNRAIELDDTDYLIYLNRSNTNHQLENMDAVCSDCRILEQKYKGKEITDEEHINEIKHTLNEVCDSTKASYYYQRGIAFYNLNQMEEAVTMYRRGIQKFPDHCMLHSFLGNALLKKGEFKSALTAYEQCFKLTDNLVDEFASNGSYAVSFYDYVSFKKSFDATNYNSIAECYVQLNDLALAKSNIDKAFEQGVKDPGVRSSFHNTRGYIYLLEGKYALALSEFEEGINLFDENPISYVNRAIAKVSSQSPSKTQVITLGNSTIGQPIQFEWNPSQQKKTEQNRELLLSALNDCDNAIGLEAECWYAYYVRGQIKQLLSMDGACLDLLTAQQHGFEVDASMLQGCH